MGEITINIMGQDVTASKFAYDGCHKIYIIEDVNDLKDAIDCGYEIKDMKSLKNVYNKSCSLKFINNWKLDKCFVGQDVRWYPYAK